MGSRVGVMKVAAKRVGITASEYEANLAAGLKWCRSCRQFIPWMLLESTVPGRTGWPPNAARARAPARHRRGVRWTTPLRGCDVCPFETGMLTKLGRESLT